MHIWTQRRRPHYPVGNGEALPRYVDIAIVGGGLSGVLTAYALRRRGLRVVVLEAGEIGHGGCGDSIGMLGLGDARLTDIEKKYGTEGAALAVHLMEEAMDDYLSLSARLSLRAEPEPRPAVLYSKRADGRINVEAEVARRAGLAVEIRRHTELPFPISEALSYPGMWVDPVLFLFGVARQVPVYAGVRVTHCEDDTLMTDEGDEITAEEIIFACRMPPPCNIPIRLPPLTFTRARIQLLSGVAPMRGMYTGIDDDGMRFVTQGDLTSVAVSPTSMWEGRDIISHYYPMAETQGIYEAWDIQTPDRLPLIGRLSPTTPHHYFAGGYGGHGLCHAMTASALLTALIMGEGHPAEWLYSPMRRGAWQTPRTLRRAEAADEFMPPPVY